jgi:hypothetical protein
VNGVIDFQHHHDAERRRAERKRALLDFAIYSDRAQAAELRLWAYQDDRYPEQREMALELAAKCERNAEMQERMRINGRIRPEDRQRIERLLPVIGAVLGDATFTAKDVLIAAGGNAGAGLRIVLHTVSARSLGRLFKRCDGIIVDTYRLASSGHDRRARTWHIERIEPR